MVQVRIVRLGLHACTRHAIIMQLAWPVQAASVTLAIAARETVDVRQV
jgi:hypothetical protein